MERARDQRVLLASAQTGRTVVTHNRKDFRLLHDAWRDWSAAWGVVAQHSGILIVAEVPAPVLAEELDRFLAGGPTVENQLYEWGRISGWRQRA